MAYTKLFSSIVTSTIWVESDRTRLVWITMLAIADKNGEIQASVPGLARIAGVPISDCEEALKKFLGPDPYSRTPDDQGRRIEEIPGGWALLNYAKYRNMASKEDQKQKATERQRRKRDRESRNEDLSRPVTDCHALEGSCHAEMSPGHASVTQDRDIAEAEAEAEAKKYNPPPPADADEGARKVASLHDGRHHAITSQWGERYSKHFGGTYVFHGKDAAKLKKFLGICKDDAETILSVAEKAWSRAKSDRFAGRCKKAATISGFCEAFNDIRAELSTPEDKSSKNASNGRSWGDPSKDGGSVIYR